MLTRYIKVASKMSAKNRKNANTPANLESQRSYPIENKNEVIHRPRVT